MRLERCWFCSSTVYPGHGITFVRNDCRVFRFCRSKCHKNFKMRRNPRKVAWTKAYRKAHAKDLATDATFEMERRRNRPLRYNRELVQTTVKAISKIMETREKRQARFYENRMKGNKARDLQQARKELEQGTSLVRAPESLLAKPAVEAAKQKLKIRVAKPQQTVQAMES
eukprot:jgi/Chlat1/3153/Chrsp21S03380